MRFAASLALSQTLVWASAAITLGPGESRIASSSRKIVPSVTSLGDAPPRAAIIALASEENLSHMIDTVTQLERSFTADYDYDWIFFSSTVLSENFRRQTSNATRSTCLYEVISDEHWRRASSAVSGWDQSTDDERSATPVRTEARLWNPAFLLRGHRMRNYEWFLRVEPGAQFSGPIGFDVFRFMRDNGIAYGFTESAFDCNILGALSPLVSVFIDKHPHLLHQDANIGWLFNDPAAARQPIETHGEKLACSTEAECNQKCLNKQSANEPEADPFTAAFSAWLSSSYPPSFELGSIAFLRGESHQALMSHLENLDAVLQYSPVHDVPLLTLSASMFLPKQSVWNFRTKLTGYAAAKPTPTAAPPREYHRESFLFDEQALAEGALAEQHKLWNQMAVDVTRYSLSPGLISGNTVVDERTFRFSAMMGEAFVPSHGGIDE